MPTSNLALWPLLLEKIAEVDRQLGVPVRVLDVGAGRGKAAGLIREYVNPDAVVDAVEAEPRYVAWDRFPTITYDAVRVGNVTGLTDQDLCAYHVVLMVDVIEHMAWTEGRDLIQRSPRWVIVCTPVEWFQNPEHREYPTEEHRSHWKRSHFQHLGFQSVEEHLGGIVAVRQP